MDNTGIENAVISNEGMGEKIRKPEITFDKSGTTIIYRNLQLNADNPISSEVTVVVQKHPTTLLEGKSYASNTILIDGETERMSEMASQAEALKAVPETQRPRAVLDLLRSNVHYAYDDVVETVSKSDPELASWITLNTGVNASASNVPLSELIDKGHGVCRHLAVAYLWLAQKAGLVGTLMVSDYGGVKNVKRIDTGEQLFKSVEVGQPLPAHAWTEIKTNDGQWIPVDPSVKLVGDTEEGLATFREAGYEGIWGYGIETNAEPAELLPNSTRMTLAPAQPTAEAKFSMILKSTKPTIRLFKENLPPTNTPYSGEGKLQINTTQNSGIVNLSLVSVK